MKPKLKPGQNLESIQSDLIETVCSNYTNGVSIRALAKKMKMSPMKVRKILITGHAYATDLSIEINDLWKDGKTVEEIAEILSMTTSNVNSYLPYERIIYNMDERSVEADRQARYRARKKGLIPLVPEKEKFKNKTPRTRNKTMIIVVGKKLKKLLPKDIFDNASDPLSREHLSRPANTLLEDPPDPDKMIWCAELTTAGRGKDKKQGIILESANCGFVVICPVPDKPESDVNISHEEIVEFRRTFEQKILDSIRSGMLAFSLPEDKVLDYIDTIKNIEIVRGKQSMPAARLEELIEQEIKWEKGEDPIERFNVRGNFTHRKYGNNVYYRNVSDSLCNMLEMNDVERKVWIDEYFGTLREKICCK